ncbi:hypothetical protein PR048_012060 [Dryococelus australis]|uniref:Uncharacterized protein n=1 Tax=Dryococelus australis TaxID=614101 RepID=A0ABQ9HN96_9NEOP|nr:hypothetical protein PR048_012060 [Dryococelus australis]
MKFFLAASGNFIPLSEVKIADDVSAEISKSIPLLEHCRLLQPNQRTCEHSISDITSVTRVLPVDIDLDMLVDEWKILQQEDVCNAYDCIEGYWKYPNVTLVVNATLCLSHGNANVGCNFSVSGKFLTKIKDQ